MISGVTSPRVPPELSDQIIAHLNGDTSALSACGLVCRNWLPAVRHHRFDSVVLQYPEVEDFLHLLDQSPEIGRFVTSLSCRSKRLSWTRRGITSKVVRDLSCIVEKLTYITKLGLCGFIASEATLREPLARFSVVLSNSSVKALHFTTCNASFGFLSILVASCPLLETLVIEMASIRLSKRDNMMVSNRRHLQSLSLTQMTNTNPAGFLDWITGDLADFRLPNLSIGVWDANDAPLAAAALQRFNHSMSEFHLTVNADASLPQLFGNVDLELEKCQQLQHCRLTFHLREMFVAENQSLPWIHDLIARLSSPVLETIEISVFADPMTDLRALDSECGTRSLDKVSFDAMDALDWRRLECIFTSSILGSLRKVVLVGQGDPSGMRTFLAESHPALQCIIHFR
ncbi:unnamed protein product [Somion occarium]|uniref:F-box domain-containing protein n=1 Tax=Somion occarium TaxID=3059160 RepID=A0ABP1CVA8_9APHY